MLIKPPQQLHHREAIAHSLQQWETIGKPQVIAYRPVSERLCAPNKQLIQFINAHDSSENKDETMKNSFETTLSGFKICCPNMILKYRLEGLTPKMKRALMSSSGRQCLVHFLAEIRLLT